MFTLKTSTHRRWLVKEFLTGLPVEIEVGQSVELQFNYNGVCRTAPGFPGSSKYLKLFKHGSCSRAALEDAFIYLLPCRRLLPPII